MPLAPSMKQMEDSLATTSCKPLGAVVDMESALRAESTALTVIANAESDCHHGRAVIGAACGDSCPLRCLPLARVGGAEDGFDDGHVLNGVLNGDGDFGVVEDGSREGVAL